MQTIKISGDKIRSALNTIDKKDNREYLRGIYLNSEAEELVSTDGKILYLARNVETFDESTVIPWFDCKKNILSVIFTKDGDTLNIKQYSKKGLESELIIKLVVNDFQFPSYSRLVTGIEIMLVESIGISLELISKVAKIFNNQYAALSFTNTDAPIKITNADCPDELVILMPARVKVNNAIMGINEDE